MYDTIRKIKRIVAGKPAIDGAGVKLIRIFGYNDTKDFDPFLLFDAFGSTNPADYIKGFPWHPHRGIETVTYLIDGNIEHSDSMGNKDNILAGDCQWMTAGSGIIHQEMPLATDGLLGAQLWINLPAKHKMVLPTYGPISRRDIPIINEQNANVHIIAGNYKGFRGAFEGKYVNALYLDVELNSSSEWTLETEAENTLFIYVVQGEAFVAKDYEHKISVKNVILFDKGEQFHIKTLDLPTRFLAISGKPLNEPISWGGPIVMNTRQELDKAFLELEDGTFIK